MRVPALAFVLLVAAVNLGVSARAAPPVPAPSSAPTVVRLSSKGPLDPELLVVLGELLGRAGLRLVVGPTTEPLAAELTLEETADSATVTATDPRGRLTQSTRQVTRVDAPAVYREALAHVAFAAVEAIGAVPPRRPAPPPVGPVGTVVPPPTAEPAVTPSASPPPSAAPPPAKAPSAAPRVIAPKRPTPPQPPPPRPRVSAPDQQNQVKSAAEPARYSLEFRAGPTRLGPEAYGGQLGIAVTGALATNTRLALEAGGVVFAPLKRRGVEAHVWLAPLRLRLRQRVLQLEDVDFDVGLAAGVEVLGLDVVEAPPGTTASEPIRRLQPVLGPSLAVRWHPTPALAVGALLSAELDASPRRLLVDEPQAGTPLLATDRVRGTLLLTLEWAPEAMP